MIVQTDTDFGERIPLTIADADTGRGSITLIFQTIGKSTHNLANLEVGESVNNILGPLGQPTHIDKFGTVVCVGGGIGVAPLHPIAQGLKKAGNRMIIIIGARTKDLVILEEEMKAIADELIICTDDGSYGRKDLVTAPLKEVCEHEPKPDMAVAIGPPVMMSSVLKLQGPTVSIPSCRSHTIMVDHRDVGGCRVSVGGETNSSADGPGFDGHKVDFDNMMLRLGSYKNRGRSAPSLSS